MVSVATRVEELRRQLRAQAPFLGDREGVPSGLEALDGLLGGGFPGGAVTVLSGVPGSGRMTLATALLARHTRAGRPVAWIDGRGTLYPPALAAAGVDLERVLMVRGGGARTAYAVEQIIESGAFGVVVASGLERLLGPAVARRIQTSTEAARISTLLLLDPSAAGPITQAALKLQLSRRSGGILVEVEKDRSGRAAGRRAMVST